MNKLFPFCLLVSFALPLISYGQATSPTVIPFINNPATATYQWTASTGVWQGNISPGGGASGAGFSDGDGTTFSSGAKVNIYLGTQITLGTLNIGQNSGGTLTIQSNSTANSTDGTGVLTLTTDYSSLNPQGGGLAANLNISGASNEFIYAPLNIYGQTSVGDNSTGAATSLTIAGPLTIGNATLPPPSLNLNPQQGFMDITGSGGTINVTGNTLVNPVSDFNGMSGIFVRSTTLNIAGTSNIFLGRVLVSGGALNFTGLGNSFANPTNAAVDSLNVTGGTVNFGPTTASATGTSSFTGTLNLPQYQSGGGSLNTGVVNIGANSTAAANNNANFVIDAGNLLMGGGTLNLQTGTGAGTTVLLGGSSVAFNATGMGNGIASIAVDSTQGLNVGMRVFGAGIPNNSVIVAILGNTIVLNNTATASNPVNIQSNNAIIPVPLMAAQGNVSLTGSGSSASNQITVSSTAGLSVGMVLGPNVVVANATSMTSGSVTISVSSTVGLVQGMSVSGVGIPTGATIASVGTNQVTLTTAPTLTLASSTTNVALTFTQNTGLATGTTILGISGNTLTLSAPPISTLTNTPIAAFAQGTLAVNGGLLQFQGGSTGLVKIDPSVTLQVGGSAILNIAGTNQNYQFFSLQPTAAVTVSGSTASGSNVVQVLNSSGMIAGQTITGPGIPAGSYITSVDNSGTSVTINQNATATGSINVSAFSSTPIIESTLPTSSVYVISSSTGSSSVTVGAVPADLQVGSAFMGTTVSKISGTTITLNANANVTLANSYYNFAYTGAGSSTLMVGNSSGTADAFYGVLNFTGSTANSALVKVGTNTLTLGGSLDNTLAHVMAEGGTVVLAKASSPTVHAIDGPAGNVGTLQIGLAPTGTYATVQIGGSFPFAANFVSNPSNYRDQIAYNATVNFLDATGRLDLNGYSEGFDQLTGPGTVLNNASGLSTLILGENNGTFSFSGQLIDNSGTGGQLGLLKTGAGTATFTGVSTNTGLITIGQGTLTLSGATGALAGAGMIAVADGTLLLDNTSNNLSSRLSSLDSIVLKNGVLQVNNTGAGGAANNTVEAAGALTSSAGLDIVKINHAFTTSSNSVALVFSGYNRTVGSQTLIEEAATTVGNFVTVATTASAVTAGSTSMTVSSSTSIANGMFVSGPGIPAGTTVISGGGTTSLTLSTYATASSAGGTYTFSTSEVAVGTTLLGSGTSGTSTITIPVNGAFTVGLAVGQTVVGPGIPAGTTILGITSNASSTVITLSAPLTSNATSAAFTFGSPVASSLLATGTTNGSTTVLMPSTLGVQIGMTVTGAGIPANTTVTAVSAGSITLSNGATVTASSVPLTFSTTGATSGMLIGAGGAANTPGVSLVVGAFGGTNASSTQDFMTVTGSAIRPLLTAEYSSITSGTQTSNVGSLSGTLSILLDTAYNSLKFTGNSSYSLSILNDKELKLGGNTDPFFGTTTLGAGMMVFDVTGSSITTISGGYLDFGAQDGIVRLNNANVVISSSLSGGGLTVSAASAAYTLELQGDSRTRSLSPGLTGTVTVDSGALQVVRNGALGSTSSIQLMGETLQSSLLLNNGVTVNEGLTMGWGSQVRVMGLSEPIGGSATPGQGQQSVLNGNLTINSANAGGSNVSSTILVDGSSGFTVLGTVSGPALGSGNDLDASFTGAIGRQLILQNGNSGVDGYVNLLGNISDLGGNTAAPNGDYQKLNLVVSSQNIGTGGTAAGNENNQFNVTLGNADNLGGQMVVRSGIVTLTGNYGTGTTAGSTLPLFMELNTGVAAPNYNQIGAVLLATPGSTYNVSNITWGENNAAYNASSYGLIGSLTTSGVVTVGNGTGTTSLIASSNAATSNGVTVSYGSISLTNGNNTFTVSSTKDLVVGMFVTGTGIPTSTQVYITAINGNQVTLSAAASSTVSNQTLTFSEKFLQSSSGGAGNYSLNIGGTIPAQTTLIQPGMMVSGAGIQAGTFVMSVDYTNNRIVLSQPTNNTVSTLSFNAGAQYVSAGLYARAGGELDVATNFKDTNSFSLAGVVGAIDKVGVGTVRVTGSSAGAGNVNGGVNLQGGTLIFDYTTNNNSVVSSSSSSASQLTLAGGMLDLVGAYSSTGSEYIQGLLTMQPGDSVIKVSPTGPSSSQYLYLGFVNGAGTVADVNRYAGSTMRFWGDTSTGGNPSIYLNLPSLYTNNPAVVLPYAAYYNPTNNGYTDFASVSVGGGVSSAANYYTTQDDVTSWTAAIMAQSPIQNSSSRGYVGWMSEGTVGFTGTTSISTISSPPTGQATGVYTIRFEAPSTGSLTGNSVPGTLNIGSSGLVLYSDAINSGVLGGAILVSSDVGANSKFITGGALTSALATNYANTTALSKSEDLIIMNFSQGVTQGATGSATQGSLVIQSDIQNFNSLPVNLVSSGDGVTHILQNATGNTYKSYTGNNYINGNPTWLSSTTTASSNVVNVASTVVAGTVNNLTVATTANSTTVTVTAGDTTNLQQGQAIFGPGIPPGTYLAAPPNPVTDENTGITTYYLTLTQAATATGSQSVTTAVSAIQIGHAISGVGIPTGSIITGISSLTSFTISGPATQTGTNVLIYDTNTLWVSSLDTISKANAASTFNLNGGTLMVAADTSPLTTALGNVTPAATHNWVLGGNGGIISLPNAGTTLTIGGQISTVPNDPSLSSGIIRTSNLGVGDLYVQGPGTLVLTNQTNSYNGITDVQSGTLQINVTQKSSSVLGSNYGFIDSTYIEAGSTLAMNVTGETSSSNGFGTGEFLTFNGTAANLAVFNATLGTSASSGFNNDGVLDGVINIAGPTTFNVTGGNAATAASLTSALDVLRFNPDSNYLEGTGAITKTGTGAIMLYQNNVEFNGAWNINQGLVIGRSQGTPFGVGSTINLGNSSAPSGSIAGIFLEGMATSTTPFAVDYTVKQNIVANFSANQTLYLGARNYDDNIVSGAQNDRYSFTGTLTLNGTSASNILNLAYIDNVNNTAIAAGGNRYINLAGNISGIGSLQTQIVDAGHTVSSSPALTVTYNLSGNNSGWTQGNLKMGNATSDTTLNAIVRLSSANALNSAIGVQMGYNSTLQIAGNNITIASLTDLPGTSGLGGTAFVVNASNSPGTLTLTVNGAVSYDMVFQDGATPAIYSAPNAPVHDNTLSLVFAGTAGSVVTLNQINGYTGSTTVTGGTLLTGVTNAFSSKSAVILAPSSASVGAALNINNLSTTIAGLIIGGASNSISSVALGSGSTGSLTLSSLAGITSTVTSTALNTVSAPTAGLVVGQSVTGTNIPQGDYITSINSANNTFTLAIPATQAFASQNLYIGGGLTYNYNNGTNTPGTATITGASPSTGLVLANSGSFTTNFIIFPGGSSPDVNINAVISGSYATTGGLVLSGGGTLELSPPGGNANTYLGATTVLGGTLLGGANNFLPSTTALTLSAVNAGATATLNMGGFNTTVTTVTMGGGTSTSGSLITGSGVLTLSSSVGITFNATNNPLPGVISSNINVGYSGQQSIAVGLLTYSGYNANLPQSGNPDLTINGLISSSGTSGLKLAGAGTLLLTNNNNNFTGPIAVPSGTLVISNDGQLGSGTNTVALTGGVLEIAGGTSSNPVTVTSGRSFTVSGAGTIFTDPYTTFQINGVVIGTSLTVNGTGTLNLANPNGNNNIATQLTISNGTVQLLNTGALVASAGSNSIYLAPTSGVAGSSATLIVAPNTTQYVQTLSFNPPPSGAAIAQQSISTVTLGSGSNLNSNGGITYDSSGSPAYIGLATIGGTGNLALTATSHTIAVNGNATGNVNGSYADGLLISAPITGSQSSQSSTIINKMGAGVLSLTGTNTFVGNVTVAQGTLLIASDNALGASGNTITLGGPTAPLNFNITSTAGSATATVSSATNLFVGEYLSTSNANFPAYTYITAINGTQITLSNAAINTASAVSTPIYWTPTLGSTAGAASFTVDSSHTISINGANTVLTGFSTASSTTTLTIAANITGGLAGNNILIQGPGTVVFSGTNSYLGNTVITGGTLTTTGGGLPTSTPTTLIFSPATAGGSAIANIGGGTVTVAGIVFNGADNSTSTLNITSTSFNLTGNITYNAANSVNPNNPGQAVINGNIVLSSGSHSINAAFSKNTPVGQELVFNGIISGAGSITTTGSGTGAVVFNPGSGGNSYSGITTIGAGDSISIAADNYLGVAPASLTANQLTLSGTSLTNLGTLITTGSSVTLSPNRGINLNTFGALAPVLNNTLTVQAPIEGGTLVMDGAGTLILGPFGSSTSSTYTGNTYITSGTLQLGVSNSTYNVLPTGTTVIISPGLVDGTSTSATFNMAGFNASIKGLTFAGISGSSPTINIGGGTLTLSGDIFYDAVNNPNAVTLGSSGTLSLGTGNHNIMVGQGTVATNGLTISTGLTGAGTITKLGPGTLTLSGSNGLTGNSLTISGGTVLFNSASAVSTSYTSLAFNWSAGGALAASSGTVGGTTFTVTSTTGLAVGQVVSGPGIPLNTVVTSIGTSSPYVITLSDPIQTGYTSGESVSFTPSTPTLATSVNVSLPSTLGVVLSSTANSVQALAPGAGTTLSIAGAISGGAVGTGTLQINGLGTVALSGVNTFVSNVSILSGALTTSSATAFYATTPVSVTMAPLAASTTATGTAGLTIGASNTIASLIIGGAANTTSTVTINSSAILTLKSATSLINYQGTNNPGAATITGAGTLALGNTSGAATINVDPSTNAAVGLTINPVITGSNGFTKTGEGVLVLNNAETYTGTTTIAAGTVGLGSAATAALAPTSVLTLAPTVANDTVTFDINGRTQSFSTVINLISAAAGGTDMIVDSAATKGTLSLTASTAGITYTSGLATNGYGATVSANIGLASGTSPVFNIGTVGTGSPTTYGLTVSGGISGAGSFTKTGPGLLYLSGTNSYTGATTITGGTLVIGAANALNNTSGVALNWAASASMASTGTATTGTTLTVSSASGLTVGEVVTGTGIAPNTFITGISGNVLTISSSLLGAFVSNESVTYSTSTPTLGTSASSTVTLPSTLGVALNTTASSIWAFAPATGSTLTINGVVSGGVSTGTLQISGLGTTVLGNTGNGFTGTVAIGAGATLQISDVRNLGTSTNPLTFSGTSSSAATLATTAATNVANPITIAAGNYGTFAPASNTTLTISSAIDSSALAGNVVMSGQGTLALTSTTSKYSGSTILNSGTVSISADSNLGAPTVFSATNIVFNGGTLATTATVTFNTFRGITINSGGTANFAPGNTYTLTIPTVITGSGSLTMSGAGTLTLTGANTYTGNTTVLSGTLSTTTAAALPAATNVFVMPSTASGSAALSVGFNDTITSLTMGGAANSLPTVNISAGTTLTINNGAGNLITYPGTNNPGGAVINASNATTSILALGSSGVIEVDLSTATSAVNAELTINPVIGGGTNGFTKTGEGVLILNNTETYTGATIINAGSIKLGSNSSPSTTGALASASALTISPTTTSFVDTVTFDLNGHSQTLSGGINLVSQNGDIDKIISSSGGASLVLNASSYGVTSGGVFSGNSGVAYTVPNAANPGQGAVISVPVNVTGPVIFNVASSSLSNGADLTISGAITNGTAGAGGIVKTGAGVLVLSGANSYSGPTNIEGGTLTFANVGAISTGNTQIVLNNATLQESISLSLPTGVGISLGSTGGGGTIMLPAGVVMTIPGTGTGYIGTYKLTGSTAAPVATPTTGTFAANSSTISVGSGANIAAGQMISGYGIPIGDTVLSVSGPGINATVTLKSPTVGASFSTILSNSTLSTTSQTITVSSTSNLYLGEVLTGTGIPAGSYVTNIVDLTHLTINNTPTVNNSSTSLTFGTPSAVAFSNSAGTSNVITGLSTTAGLYIGELVNSAYFPAGTYITAINSATQVTVSNVALAASTGQPVSFGSTGGLTLTGGGTLSLGNSNNDYTGPTVINGGILKVSKLSMEGTVTGVTGYATTTASTTTLYLTNPGLTAGIVVGQVITGPGIAPGTTVVGIGSNYLTLSSGITVTNANTNLAFTLTGTPSSIGAAPQTASNLVILGGTLEYTGLGGTTATLPATPAGLTDRLMTIGGTGANITYTNPTGDQLVFNNTGSIVYQTSNVDQALNLAASTGSTVVNIFAPSIADNGTGRTSLTINGFVNNTLFTGSWALGGTNTYSGNTTVLGGQLFASASYAFSPYSTIYLTPGIGTGNTSTSAGVNLGSAMVLPATTNSTTKNIVTVNNYSTGLITKGMWVSGGGVPTGAYSTGTYVTAVSTPAGGVTTVTLNNNVNTGTNNLTFYNILLGTITATYANGQSSVQYSAMTAQGAGTVTPKVGMAVVGTGISAGTFILQVLDSTHFLLSQPPTAAATSGTLYFADPTNAYVENVPGLYFGGAANTQSSVQIGLGQMNLTGNITYDATNNPAGATISSASFSITGNAAAAFTYGISGKLIIGPSTPTFNIGSSTNSNGADLTISAAISGPTSTFGTGPGIIKTGNGVLVLTNGSNSWVGTTEVDAGTVVIAGNNAMPGSSNLLLSPGASGSTLFSLSAPSFNATTSSTVSSGSGSITMSSTSGLVVGALVTGSSSLPANTFITAINGTTVTLSNAITGTISTNTSLTFTPPVATNVGGITFQGQAGSNSNISMAIQTSTLTLAGDVNYSGAYGANASTISGGQLNLGTANSNGARNINLSHGSNVANGSPDLTISSIVTGSTLPLLLNNNTLTNSTVNVTAVLQLLNINTNGLFVGESIQGYLNDSLPAGTVITAIGTNSVTLSQAPTTNGTINLQVAFNGTGNLTSGSTTVTGLSNALMSSLAIGVGVQGPGIPAGAVIIAVNNTGNPATNTVTLSSAPTSSTTGAALSMTNNQFGGDATVSNVISNISTAGLYVGEMVSGSVIQPGTYISAIGANSVTLSQTPSGVASGSGVQFGGSVLSLTNAGNTFSTATVVTYGASLLIGADGALGTASVASPNYLALDGGTLSTSANISTNPNRTFVMGRGPSLGGLLAPATGTVLTINGVVSSGYDPISGFTNSGWGSTGGYLSMVGKGGLVLANTNTYLGDTNVASGSLQVGVGGVGTTGMGQTIVSQGANLYGTGTVTGYSGQGSGSQFSANFNGTSYSNGSSTTTTNPYVISVVGTGSGLEVGMSVGDNGGGYIQAGTVITAIDGTTVTLSKAPTTTSTAPLPIYVTSNHVVNGNIQPGDIVSTNNPNVLGTLTVTGNLTLSSTSNLTLNLGTAANTSIPSNTAYIGNAPAAESAALQALKNAGYGRTTNSSSPTNGSPDYLVISGTLTMQNGTITVNNPYSMNLVAGDVLDLINWGSVVPNGFNVGGQFRDGGWANSSLYLPTLTAGLQWDTNLLFNTGSNNHDSILLVVAIAPEPGRITLLLLGMVTLLLRRRRRRI